MVADVNDLIAGHRNLAWKLAHWASGLIAPDLADLDELYTAALGGIWEAAVRYRADHDSGAKFITFAWLAARHRMMHLMEKRTREAARRRRRGEWRLGDLSSPDIADALTWHDRTPDDAPDVRAWVAELRDQQRRAVEAYYGLDGEPRDDRAVAAEWGCSQQNVNRLRRAGLRRLADRAKGVA
jgi:RNA polymerase sigma factor (sigma-70 family)